MKKRVVAAICVLLATEGYGHIPQEKGWNLYQPYRRYLLRLPDDILRSFFYKASTEKKEIALTFDDGPLVRSRKLTAFLRRRKIPATFFLLAKNINSSNAALYRYPLFETGIHGYRHSDFRKLSRDRIRQELKRSIGIFEHYGLGHRYFRPPYGMVSRSLSKAVEKFGLQGVLWSIDSGDWNRSRGKKVLHNTIDQIGPGSILLFHDHSISIRDLSIIIDAIERNGYRIVPLSRLIHEKNGLP
jgi:peptidoglycan/xylan/chitin deacetylase (PgdA/CDA1 family)